MITIIEADLKEMNGLLKKGSTISQISNKYPKYDYWDIYWKVNDVSFLGKKRAITNRLNKLSSEKTQSNRRILAKEAQEMLDELYRILKENSKRLIEIDRILKD